MAISYTYSRSLLEGALRFDAEYYQPDYTEKANRLRSKKNAWQTFGRIVEVRGGNAFKSEAFGDIGIPIARITEVNQNTPIEQWPKLSFSEYEQFPKNLLRAGDILLGGTHHNYWDLGKVIQIVSDIECTFNQRTFKLRTLSPLLFQNYLFTFLCTKYARFQFERLGRGNNQLNLNQPELFSVEIYVASNTLQKHVSEMIDIRNNKIIESFSLIWKAEQLLFSELGLQGWKPTHDLTFARSYSQAAKAGRMDAEYFQPKFDDILRLLSEYPLQRLSKLANQVNETVTFSESQKYRYIEISDVNTTNGEVGYTEREVKELPPNAKIKVKGGELIISKVRPTRGAIGIIPDACQKNGVCSSAFVVLNIPSPVREFLQVYLRSLVGKTLLEQPCKGTSYPTIDDIDVLSLPMPTISTKAQVKISELVIQSDKARREAKSLLEKAKQAVEIAIVENEERAIEFIG